MEQKLNYPNDESDVRLILDNLYEESRQCFSQGERPRFSGLLEIIASEAVILTAIHNIKGNSGSNTPGSDNQTIQHVLTARYEEVISLVKGQFIRYSPQQIRRVFIPKPGKPEKRPLGIPAIVDRIVQECVRLVIEPILEAQFFKHSYGFRPMRDAHMVLERVSDLVHKTGYHWVVEGDISKFFDNVDHTILVKRLWGLGIRDRRVLMIIKSMLKAGTMGEIGQNDIGTPQGGILSPLLANAYLDALDCWVTREWEQKKTRFPYKNQKDRLQLLNKKSNLKPIYLVRYADDWVLITNSKENALKWKHRVATFLKNSLRLELSAEKTLITNIRGKAIRFLGFELKLAKGKARTGYTVRTSPNPDRLRSKMEELLNKVKAIRRTQHTSKEKIIHQINLINSTIRGIIQYYAAATRVSVSLDRYAYIIKYASFKALKGFGGTWTPAKQVSNLLSVHSDYNTAIPAIEYRGLKVGITSLSFATWRKTKLKNPDETPYTREGRKLYIERSGNIPLKVRADSILRLHRSRMIMQNKDRGKYNFEYYLNRAYVFNQDKGKCRVCGEPIEILDLHIHHRRPKLPIYEVNKVKQLASVHNLCHEMIHDSHDHSELTSKVWRKIRKFRDELLEH